jgi:recombination protein RecA
VAAKKKKKTLIKNTKPEKTSVDVLIDDIRKEYGTDSITLDPEWDNTKRFPTGNFAFDYASGGGFPMGRVSVIYGQESSLKTSLTLMCIAQAQRNYPDKVCVFIDLEGHFDPAHAKSFGVNVQKLLYSTPGSAEDAVDIVEKLIYAEDVILIVIDSLAAMVTERELDSSASKAVVGGSGLVIGKLYRKMGRALNAIRATGRNPAVLCINQIRYKIGVMFGNPEVMPGGQAFKYVSSMTVKVSAKDLADGKIDPDQPCWKHCKFSIVKRKVPILAKDGEFDLAIINSKFFTAGQIDDWNILKDRMIDYGILTSVKKGYDIFDVEYPTYKAIRDRYLSDKDFATSVCTAIMDIALGHVPMAEMHEDDVLEVPEAEQDEVDEVDVP